MLFDQDPRAAVSTTFAAICTICSPAFPQIVSDDFNRCALDPAVWTEVDPLGGASFDLIGAGTNDAYMAITVPPGDAYEAWVENTAARLMQPTDDVDFQVVAKFDSRPSITFQEQGILVAQAADTFLRAEFFSTNNALRFFVATLVESTPTILTSISINGNVAPSGPLWLRVTRAGDLWTVEYSDDGATWQSTAATTDFLFDLDVSRVGPHCGSDDVGYTALVDYFFNTAAPIEPEDGPVQTGETFTFDVQTVGSGTVTLEPDLPTYACASTVTLTAIPDAGWTFTGWTGGVNSLDNPLIVQATSDLQILASFVSPTLFVDASARGSGTGESWTNGFTELREALAVAAIASNNIEEIRVAAGSYAPLPGDPSSSFMLVDGVWILGGFPSGGGGDSERDPIANPTVLTGDLDGDDLLGPPFGSVNSYHVVTADASVGPTAVLDGFTVTAGSANGEELDARGGGLFIEGGSPTIQNCRFVGNEAYVGAAVSGEGGGPTFVRCEFSNNAAELAGGGVDFQGGATPTFQNCRITSNTSHRSAGVALGSETGPGSPTFINSMIYDNVATGGDGAAVVASNGSVATLINSTVVENAAPSGAIGGIRASNASSAVNLVNSIVWNNTDSMGGGEAAQLATFFGAAMNVNHCCIEEWTGTFGGAGNIGADPLFVDPSIADFRLRGASPAIDAADNTAVPLDELDLDGDGDTSERIPIDLNELPRFTDRPATPDTGVPDGVNPIVDMGAFEHEPQPCLADLDGNGMVGFADLTMLLAAWGPCGDCPEDIAGVSDGIVGFDDLTALLGNWGPCP